MEHIFENGLAVSEVKIEQCAKVVLEAIKAELPEELQVYELYLYILKYTGEKLKFKKISL